MIIDHWLISLHHRNKRPYTKLLTADLFRYLLIKWGTRWIVCWKYISSLRREVAKPTQLIFWSKYFIRQNIHTKELCLLKRTDRVSEKNLFLRFQKCYMFWYFWPILVILSTNWLSWAILGAKCTKLKFHFVWPWCFLFMTDVPPNNHTSY